MNPKEKALKLCQAFGMTTFFSDFNEGKTLPLSVAKSCAKIAAELCFQEAYKQGTEISLIRQKYWQQVKTEIEKL